MTLLRPMAYTVPRLLVKKVCPAWAVTWAARAAPSASQVADTCTGRLEQMALRLAEGATCWTSLRPQAQALPSPVAAAACAAPAAAVMAPRRYSSWVRIRLEAP
ncbi:hypothetical protein CE91St43_28050 [Oscillospiraceae bacterium]|nr:hypothetical protein CE91St43_28050 [Oscillospiraceae bacterium]